MRAILTSICMFSALITTGLCLICEHCIDIHRDSCSGISKKCNEGDMCVIKLENATAGGKSYLSIFKGCEKEDPRICGNVLDSNSTGFSFIFYTVCCKEDNCNSRKVIVPPINTTENGLECPSCYISGSFECTTTETIKCVGTQEQCFDFSGEMRLPGQKFQPQAIKGCTRAGGCEVGFPVVKGMTIVEQKRLECT
uniref:Phospholipase A2 inhibitor and Ly6/PLAUR domain-containing protein-like n=1 Tax=Geotrypetes seraphini TaxID=260995 RepID=A0A6P8SJ83_GEOSA|nr:phospholipase A2 inhibitor and Ly6/PLAUR domain-containing protein-like [Geotrypetes seraphini]